MDRSFRGAARTFTLTKPSSTGPHPLRQQCPRNPDARGLGGELATLAAVHTLPVLPASAGVGLSAGVPRGSTNWASAAVCRCDGDVVTLAELRRRSCCPCARKN